MSNLAVEKSYLDRLVSTDGRGCECFRPAFIDSARAELAALRARIAELEAQSTTLTPRRCSRECYLLGWQDAIEAAENHCKDFANRTNIYRDAIDTKRNRAVRGEHIIYENLAAYFRALQPPADCGDCNPLKPSEHDTDMLDEWHKRM